jgi:hypothetical protein
MNRLAKTALVVAAGAAIMTSAQAQYNSGDLVIGFHNGSAASDVVFDLGTASSIGVGGSTTVNLNSFISSSLLTTTLGSLSQMELGVIGGNSDITGTFVYSTVPNHPVIANPSAANPILTTIDTAGNTIDGSGSPANSAVVLKSNPASWSSAVLPATGNTFNKTYGNPDAVTTPAGFSGTVTEHLFFANADNATVSDVGFFTFGSDGSLSFTPTAVPEPATYGLIAGAGLLVVCLRRQLTTRKQA